MNADELREDAKWARKVRRHVWVTADQADGLADLIEWANDAPHHDGCMARFNDEQLANDPPLHPYRCKCGRDSLAALDQEAPT